MPKWHHLISALLPDFISDHTLSETWRRPGDEAFLFSSSAWSLVVVALWRQQLERKDSLTIWVPDFFCNASLQSLRDMKTRLVFYPVTDQMIPDIEACSQLATEVSPDIFVLVHYFGQPTPVAPIIPLCKESGAWLVEDAAHVLRPIPGVGELGDCVLYSMHKHLPIPDGAALIVRPNGPAQLVEKDSELVALRKICTDVLVSFKTFNHIISLWLIKRILQKFGIRSKAMTEPFRSEANSNAPVIFDFRMSILARRLLSHLGDSIDIDEIANLREQHALDWRNTLAWSNVKGALLPSPSGHTPYLASFTCESDKSAELIYEEFQHSGLPVLTWPDLPPEVIRNAAAHPTALALRHTRLYLPVHQSLKQKKIFPYGINMIEKSTKKWKLKEITFDEWEKHWQYCSMTNLLQSWEYGAAKEEVEGWQAKRYLILNDEGGPVALVQVLVKGFPVLGGIARINRGPLILNNYSDENELPIKLAALSALLREGRHQRWWMMQIAPELPSSDIVHKGLISLGLRPQTGVAWASGLIDLNLSKEELLSKLNRRWKRSLRKVSEHNVTVKHEKITDLQLEELLGSYNHLQQCNNFSGINTSLIEVLSKLKSSDWACNLFVASKLNEDDKLEELGYRLCIHHGNTVTDFVVSTNEMGRKTEANTALYWHAILHAKDIGCDWFDIGGLSEETTPKGIAEFKKGLNAEPYKLAGEWRSYMVPNFGSKAE